MRRIRLNTYTDSIERVKVHTEPQRAFQGRDPTPPPGPETHAVHPRAIQALCRRLPEIPEELLAPVFCGRARGADTPN